MLYWIIFVIHAIGWGLAVANPIEAVGYCLVGTAFILMLERVHSILEETKNG